MAGGFMLTDSNTIAPGLDDGAGGVDETAAIPPPPGARGLDGDDQTLAIDTAAAAREALARAGSAGEPDPFANLGAAARRKRMLLAGAGLAGVLIALLTAISSMGSRPHDDPSPLDPAPPGKGGLGAVGDPDPPTRPAPRVQLERLISRARRLEKGESWIDALAAWRRVRETLETEDLDEAAGGLLGRTELADTIARLDRLVAARRAFDRLEPRLDTLVTETRFDEAKEALTSLLARHPVPDGTTLKRRIEQRLIAIDDRAREPGPGPESVARKPDDGGAATGGDSAGTSDAGEARPKDKAPIRRRPETGERIARFKKLRQRGLENVRRLRRRIASDKAVARRRTLAEAERVREATKAQPIDVEVSRGYTLRDSVVIGYDETGFTIESRGRQITLRWEVADPRLAADIKQLAAGNDGESLFALGRFCVEHGLFGRARRAFEKAVRADSRVSSRVPDLDALREKTRVFQGALKRLGAGIVELDHDFGDEDELKDFDARTRASIRKGRLELRGSRIFPVIVRNLAFEDRASITIEPQSATRQALIACGFMAARRHDKPSGVLVGFQPSSLGLVLLRWEGGGTKPMTKPQQLSRTPKRLQLELENRTLRVIADGRRVLTHAWPDDEVRVRVVLAGISQGDDAVVFGSSEIKGDAGRVWLRKTFGAADARLRSVMAATDTLPVFARSEENRRRVEALGRSKLSAEDDWGLAILTPTQRTIYRSAVRILDGDKVRSFLQAWTSLRDLADAAPSCGAVFYRCAEARLRLSRRDAALRDVEQAIAGTPRFYEALALKGRLLLELGRIEEAETAVKKSLEIRPDHAEAWAVRGRAQFLEGDFEQALECLELAVALNPWQDEARALKRNLEYVIAGPPWERRFVHETAHYRIETDISKGKAKLYGEHLEAIRAFYCEQFGIDPKAKGAKRARVLIFDTREGFHSYAKLTTDDRVESFLGYYHPRFQQLLLYEGRQDATGEETLRVLYHEGFHQFSHGLIPSMPFWLSEGLAEYYAGSRVEGGRVTARGRLHPGRVRDLLRYTKDAPPVEFSAIMRQTPGQFYSGAVAVKYAQAWSMCHYFLESDDAKARKALEVLLDQLRRGASNEEALAASFGKLDEAQLTRRWLAWIKRWKSE